jgi:hypothetical protein
MPSPSSLLLPPAPFPRIAFSKSEDEKKSFSGRYSLVPSRVGKVGSSALLPSILLGERRKYEEKKWKF